MIYLVGNSLGAMPKAAAGRVEKVVCREWGEQLIHSWNVNHWFDMSQRIGDKIAKLIGASPGEVIISDCVSVNLFKLVVAALGIKKGRWKIVTESGNFPTNLYVLQGIIRMFGGQVELVAVERSRLTDAIDDETAIVVLTHVHYKTGRMLDLKALTRHAHTQGALTLWDLCHTAGVMPVDLNTAQVDMAVGCGYKYLNGGPGAPAFLYINKDLQQETHQPVSGWWGHAQPFAFTDTYTPAADIRRAHSGTQSILAMAALEVGVDIYSGIDLEYVRSKSQKLGKLFIELIKQKCQGICIGSPENDEERGSHVAIRHDEGYAVSRALIERGVIVDFRAPDTIRFGFAPLYNSYMDAWNAVETLEQIIRTRAWESADYKQVAMVT